MVVFSGVVSTGVVMYLSAYSRVRGVLGMFFTRSDVVTTPTGVFPCVTINRFFFLIMVFAASLIDESMGIVINGELITFSNLRDSWFAVMCSSMSRSVTMPSGFSLSVTIMQPILCWVICWAASWVVLVFSIVCMGLLMISFTVKSCFD